MRAGKAITLVPRTQRLTTREAADFPGISRPTEDASETGSYGGAPEDYAAALKNARKRAAAGTAPPEMPRYTAVLDAASSCLPRSATCCCASPRNPVRNRASSWIVTAAVRAATIHDAGVRSRISLPSSHCSRNHRAADNSRVRIFLGLTTPSASSEMIHACDANDAGAPRASPWPKGGGRERSRWRSGRWTHRPGLRGGRPSRPGRRCGPGRGPWRRPAACR
jgi:hypothetical protein